MKFYKMKRKYLLVVLIFYFTACTSVPGVAVDAIDKDPQATEQPTPMVEPTEAASQNSTDYAVQYLRDKEYGQGELTVVSTMERNGEFTRYFVSYPSDGLTIYGFVNVPEGEGPFPIIIALHGYVRRGEYKTKDYSTRYADSIARKGYVVLHPNLRGFPPSDSGARGDFYSGFATDVMNLLAFARQGAGLEGIFKTADAERIGIWGHSMGGGIALRVLGVEADIKVAVLYAAVSRDWRSRVSLLYYDAEFSTPAFSVHHGRLDGTVPPRWSEELCAQLLEREIEHECYFYEDQEHTFRTAGDALFIQRNIDFFDKYLR